jgi:hypothetical protein
MLAIEHFAPGIARFFGRRRNRQATYEQQRRQRSHRASAGIQHEPVHTWGSTGECYYRSAAA